jgi:Na+/H+-dicarboxylate symporter
LVTLLAVNTLVAIFIGLLVANSLQPGRWAHLSPPTAPAPARTVGVWKDLADKIPASLVGPLVENEILSVILIALAFGMALRRVREHGRPGRSQLQQ